ncbi:helicase-like protein [Imleria badia]|nr:helicase-like protein [Imleria badia]
MTINKAEGQTVKHIGLNLSSPVFSHEQLYVALSHCTHLRNIKVLFSNHDEKRNIKTTNVV